MTALALWLALMGMWPFESPDCAAFTPSDPLVVADWMLHVTGAAFVWLRLREAVAL